MTDLRTTADRDLADQVRAHHALMVDELDHLSTDLMAATRDGGACRRRLADWIHQVLVPHAEEEEATTYAAAARLPHGAAFVAAMVREHHTLRALATAFEGADDLELAAGYARALFILFRDHQAKENELLLPMLADAGVGLGPTLHGHGHPTH